METNFYGSNIIKWGDNKNIYPKISICLHHICSRLHKSSDPLSLLPYFPIKACRIDFVYSIYFWFSFYCTCVSFKGAPLFFFCFKKYAPHAPPPPPPALNPANPLYHTYTVYLHNICKREAESCGERYSVSRRRCVVRIQFGKNILK